MISQQCCQTAGATAQNMKLARGRYGVLGSIYYMTAYIDSLSQLNVKHTGMLTRGADR